MAILSTLIAARTGIAAFAAMGIVWGTFAAVLPDLKTMLGVDEARLGLLMFMTPIAAVCAMLLAPRLGTAMGGVALPVSVGLMALAFMLPGQASAIWMFPLAMMCCGAATGLTDVLMNARVAALENERGLHLMNLTHAAYSFGYAGGAIATGTMRSHGWSPAWVMCTAGVIALSFALLAAERQGRIVGLVVPAGDKAPKLGWVPVIGGAMVLIAFMTENAAENWSALHIEKTLGGSPAEGSAAPAALAL
ncbi:MAG: MFS transporter, partial [Paracoccaceae bacterium]